MTSHPPHGIKDVDYEAIEAAVTETVRGRWFLNEFARRNRSSEMRQLLEAMARLETTVASSQGQPALPSADPSIRLLIQRIKEIAGQLDGLAREMRDAGVDERFCGAADLQARAVAGMMRNAAPVSPAPVQAPPVRPALVASRVEAAPAPAPPGVLDAAPPQPVDAAPPQPVDAAPPQAPVAAVVVSPRDQRLAALSGFDDLPLAKKLALFT